MKLHLLKSPISTARVATLLEQLHGRNVSVVPPASDMPRYPEPVVLVWTKDFKPQDHIAQEELDAVASAGRLISVIMEKVTLPIDLPKHPVVDLTGWRGSPRNAFFQDLQAYLEAAFQQSPPPVPRGPVVRLVQRMCAGVTIGVVIVFSFGFALNLLELQNNLCSINFNQPDVSDFCGKYGLGNKPTEEERIAWQARDPASCEALRVHIDQFGDTGELYDRAASMLDARRRIVDETWSSTVQETIFSQSILAEGLSTQEMAQDTALENAARDAEAGCRAFAESDFYRFVGFEVTPIEWDCFTSGGQHYCGFDGMRSCQLEKLSRTVTEVCGPAQ